jgi:hypothetical protein
LHISTDQQDSKEHTPPTVHITWCRVAGDDDLMSGLYTDQTKMLRKEEKAHASPPQKESKKRKKNQKKKKDVGVKLDKDDFPIYEQSLFSSFEAPEWLDAEQEWCVEPT